MHSLKQQMKTFKLTQKNQDIKVYKELVKNLTSMDTRRLSKFNLLALYGALMCLKYVSYSKNLSVYIITKYAPISSVVKVLQTQKQGYPTTPFDFLNINGNNASFYVSKALGVSGKNQVITTNNNTLQDAIELAKFDMNIGEIGDALVGLVDESIDGILNQSSLDISSWAYMKNKTLP